MEIKIKKIGLVLLFVIPIMLFAIVSLSGCVTQKQSEDLMNIIQENRKVKVEEENTENVLPINVETKKESTENIVHPIKDLDFVEVWKGNKLVKDWKVTTTLKVYTSPKLIFKTTQNWKGKVLFSNGKILSGNLWIVVNHEGKWTATTWEWFKQGSMIEKDRSVIMEKFADHADGLKNHIPQVGDKVYFFVSGLIRTGARNVEERSEVVEVIL